jgi:hypothetical protein
MVVWRDKDKEDMPFSYYYPAPVNRKDRNAKK